MIFRMEAHNWNIRLTKSVSTDERIPKPDHRRVSKISHESFNNLPPYQANIIQNVEGQRGVGGSGVTCVRAQHSVVVIALVGSHLGEVMAPMEAINHDLVVTTTLKIPRHKVAQIIRTPGQTIAPRIVRFES